MRPIASPLSPRSESKRKLIRDTSLNSLQSAWWTSQRRTRMPGSRNGEHHWGVILAGGDGTRLKSLTHLVSNDDRPKQFCPLLDGKTLRSEEHTSELQSLRHLVCRLLLE